MHLASSAFEPNQAIPTRYSGEGENVSPPLSWSGVPDGTKSFVLLCEDPDAPGGTFRHWAVFDIAPDRNELPEAFSHDHGFDRLRQAVNDFGKHGYGGPMPPKGHGPHRYCFRLIALDCEHLTLKPEPSVLDVEQAALAHRLAEADLTGLYERR
jgi:Raf kinase inhibitor-like YbhB/YbcL family protein